MLAPSIGTCTGHVVRTASGTLMHTTAVFRGAVHPTPPPVGVSSDPLPVHAREAPVPRSAQMGQRFVSLLSSPTPADRVVGKTAPSQLRAAKLRGSQSSDAQALSAAAAALLSCHPVPFRTAAALLVSAPALRDLAQTLPARLGAGESAGYLLFGWYKHGGLTGISSLTSVFSGVVQLLNALLAQAHPMGTWTTLGLFFSAAAGLHVDRRNAKHTYNYVLPLALPPTEQYMCVQHAVDGPLSPLAWLGPDGSSHPGFRLPRVVGQPARVDAHCLHALPTPLPHEVSANHVLLVGFSVPWVHRATAEQRQQLQSHGFRLGLSRGGGSVEGVEGVEGPGQDPPVEAEDKKEKVFAAQAENVPGTDPGLLEACLVKEGHQHIQSAEEVRLGESSDLRHDVQQPQSVTGRGAYARRLEARVFEPAN